MVNQGPNGRPAQEGARRLSVAHFLIALVLWLVCAPFVNELKYGDLIDAGLMTLVFLLAVMAGGGRHRTLVAAVVLVTPALVATWIDHLRPDAIPKEFTLVTAIVFVVFVIVHLLRFILLAPRVDNEVLCAGIATYLMMGLLWTFAYALLARLDPGAFVFGGPADPDRRLVGFEALFLSFGTLANVNFGDISLASKPARMLAIAQAMTGMFYVAMLIARLVSLYSSDEPAESTGAENPPTAVERASK